MQRHQLASFDLRLDIERTMKVKKNYMNNIIEIQAPVKARPWRGTYNAYSYGAACFQEQSANYPKISEDCLFLNVFVPSSSVCSNSSDIAVIVTIHGDVLHLKYISTTRLIFACF